MEIKTITSLDSEWEQVISYAEDCSWRAGKNLSIIMKKEMFTEWEKVLVGEAYRGHRLSQKLIQNAIKYLKGLDSRKYI